MKYEVVELNEKIVVGVSDKIIMTDDDMEAKISGLWNQLYQEGINPTIKNKINEYAIGLYTDYGKDSFTLTAGNEVSKSENSELITKIIPKGKYAKFHVEGHMVTAVSEAWEEIWKMELERNFIADFEEYLNSDFENAKVEIYISLK